MRFPRVLALALFLVVDPCLASDQPGLPVPADAGGRAANGQVDPAENLANMFPEAGNIGLAIAIVPDPHVPRYRRLFDLNLQAIQLGMLQDGYVLDRYSFPWAGTVSEEETRDNKKPLKDGGSYGLMIFRCDGWRGRTCTDPSVQRPPVARRKLPRTRVRAIYFVPDTATWGVSRKSLGEAAARIHAQLEESGRVRLLQFPGCPSGITRNTLVLLGPTFSGAMDSVGQHLGEVRRGSVTDVCLVSAFTTVSSNRRAPVRYPHLHYARLALDDGVKLLSISNLAESFGYYDPDWERNAGDSKEPQGNRRRDVAFLTEASTFGYGICNPSEGMAAADRDRVVDFCSDALTLSFPAAIADIRYGLDQQRERQRNDVQTAMKAALPSEHLTLDVGAENGSEYPESRQSKLTAASQQLALDHVLNRLEQSDPKMVVVVATDVRDRLFLFDQLRARLPSALLIDLETDILLSHPDFLHASRGAITIASANLFVRNGRTFGCEGGPGRRADENGPARKPRNPRVPLASWAVDGQGMLAAAVSRLDDLNPSITQPPCVSTAEYAARRMPVLHVVTLKGLRQISRAFDMDPRPDARENRERRQSNLRIAQWLALVCCIVIVAPWLRIQKLQGAGVGARFLEPRTLTIVVAGAASVMWTFAMFATYGKPEPESGNALLYWSGAILLLAVCGLYLCLQRLHECHAQAHELPSRYRRAIVAGCATACVLAALPALTRYLEQSDAPQVLDEDLVTRLALDIGQGMAYHVVTAVGVFIVLFLMIALATGACIMTRNNHLLASPPPGDNGESGLRLPRFPRECIFAMAAIILLMALPSLTTRLGGARLSIFGPLASQIATFVLVITTLGASVMTVVAIHSSRRIRAMTAHMARCLAPRRGCAPTDPSGENPGFWPPNEWQPNLFAATPVVVRVSPEDVAVLSQAGSWKMLIGEFLGRCEGESKHNDGKHRRAVHALFASEISLYRWFVGGAAVCAVASVCAAYLFPIEADPLILWNLGVLVVHALLAGYVATAFERDGVLSNILCNKPKKASFSGSLFAYAALPFLALGFAIAVAQVPGVVDWGGGVLALLGAIGVHL